MRIKKTSSITTMSPLAIERQKYMQTEKKTHLLTLPKTTKSAVDMEENSDIEMEPYEEISKP